MRTGRLNFGAALGQPGVRVIKMWQLGRDAVRIAQLHDGQFYVQWNIAPTRFAPGSAGWQTALPAFATFAAAKASIADALQRGTAFAGFGARAQPVVPPLAQWAPVDVVGGDVWEARYKRYFAEFRGRVGGVETWNLAYHPGGRFSLGYSMGYGLSPAEVLVRVARHLADPCDLARPMSQLRRAGCRGA